jgi:hypothetical protein
MLAYSLTVKMEAILSSETSLSRCEQEHSITLKSCLANNFRFEVDTLTHRQCKFLAVLN